MQRKIIYLAVQGACEIIGTEYRIKREQERLIALQAQQQATQAKEESNGA